MERPRTLPPLPPELELSDEDIIDAMAHVAGYIDISTEDFRAVYHLAWQHAAARLQQRRQANDTGGDDDSQGASE